MMRNLTRLRAILARAWPDVPPGLPSDRRRLVTAVEMALAQRARRAVVQRRAAQIGIAAAAAMVLVATSWEASHYVDVQRARVAERAAANTPDVAGLDILRVLQAPEADATRGAVTTETSSAAGAAMANRRVAAEGLVLKAGQTVNASDSAEIRIGSARGTSLTLEPAATLAISSLGKLQRYALERGAIRTRVAKLRADERFIVATADAEIEVHGTAFRVSVVSPEAGCGNGARTRVAVSEGVVSVRSRGIESFLAVGEEWPRGCSSVASTTSLAAGAPVLAAALPDRAQPVRVPSHRRVLHRNHHRPRLHHASLALAGLGRGGDEDTAAVDPGSTGLGGSSSLSAQNDLFAAAASAKRNGHYREAVRLFSDLIERHPDSPLLESAMVQRIRAMREADPAGLASAVTDYLERFPSGFARAEARRIASSAP